jgi:hypothetical protein
VVVSAVCDVQRRGEMEESVAENNFQPCARVARPELSSSI